MNKEKDILSILPKFTQWESIEYAWDFQCPNGHCEIGGNERKPDLIGWCETSQGYMLVFECPVCFTKFRCHCNTGDKFCRDRFEQLIFEETMSNYSVNNGEEWAKKLFDF